MHVFHPLWRYPVKLEPSYCSPATSNQFIDTWLVPFIIPASIMLDVKIITDRSISNKSHLIFQTQFAVVVKQSKFQKKKQKQQRIGSTCCVWKRCLSSLRATIFWRMYFDVIPLSVHFSVIRQYSLRVSCSRPQASNVISLQFPLSSSCPAASKRKRWSVRQLPGRVLRLVQSHLV